MSSEILLDVDLKINDGELEAFKEAVGRLVPFVEATEPRVLFYKFYLDESGGIARSVHIYADLAALKFHTEIAAPWFHAVLQHASLIKIEALGDITTDQLAEIGMVQPPEVGGGLSGFVRF